MASHLNNSWDELLKGEFDSEYFDKLRDFLNKEYAAHTVYPPKRDILSAFAHTPYENVKVVIIGQDPYIGERQANGMCFSVNDGVKCPPSLVNIYKALEYDLGIPPTTCGDLGGWLGEVHRLCHIPAQQKRKTHCLYALGRLRQKEGRAYHKPQTSHSHIRAPFAALFLPRLFAVQTFFQSE